MKNKIFGILLLILALFAFSCKAESGDEESPVPEAKTVAYTVNHYQQNVTGDDYTLFETERLEGKEGSKTAATAKNYGGFTVQPFLQQTITESSSIAVEIHYNRNVFTVSFDSKDGKEVTTQGI